MRWDPEFEEKLRFEHKIPNPDANAPPSWSCIHASEMSVDDREVKRGTRCVTCGRKIELIRPKSEISVVRLYSWVKRYNKDNIYDLSLVNPWTLDEYVIRGNRNGTKLWLMCMVAKPNEEIETDPETTLGFKSFVNMAFGPCKMVVVYSTV